MSQSKDIQFHKIAAIFPLMDEDKLLALSKNIKARGLENAILLYENQILDGRNRYAACKLAGVAPRYETFEGSKSDAVERVWSLNMERRHLSPSQAAVSVAKREAYDSEFKAEVDAMKAEAEQRMKSGKKDPLQKIEEGSANERITDHKLAEAAGTNRTYVAQARKLIQEAPEVAEEVLRGEKKLSQATKELSAPVTCANPNKELPKGDWPEMIKWASRQKFVTKEDLMKKWSNNEGDCRKRLAIAAQTAGYVVTYVGDGEYRVRKAITIQSDTSTDIKGVMAELEEKTAHALEKINCTSSREWNYEQQMKYLSRVLEIAKGFKG